MTRTYIKPLSVNDCWRGRRFKTKNYDTYETELGYILPRGVEVPEGPLMLTLHVGFSNKASDLDNVCKPFIDVLQKTYRFNDKTIYKMVLSKEIVPKGREFLDWTLSPHVLDAT